MVRRAQCRAGSDPRLMAQFTAFLAVCGLSLTRLRLSPSLNPMNRQSWKRCCCCLIYSLYPQPLRPQCLLHSGSEFGKIIFHSKSDKVYRLSLKMKFSMEKVNSIFWNQIALNDKINMAKSKPGPISVYMTSMQ